MATVENEDWDQGCFISRQLKRLLKTEPDESSVNSEIGGDIKCLPKVIDRAHQEYLCYCLNFNVWANTWMLLGKKILQYLPIKRRASRHAKQEALLWDRINKWYKYWKIVKGGCLCSKRWGVCVSSATFVNQDLKLSTLQPSKANQTRNATRWTNYMLL